MNNLDWKVNRDAQTNQATSWEAGSRRYIRGAHYNVLMNGNETELARLELITMRRDHSLTVDLRWPNYGNCLTSHVVCLENLSDLLLPLNRERRSTPTMQFRTVCPACNGKGKYVGFTTIEDPCSKCGGSGQ